MTNDRSVAIRPCSTSDLAAVHDLIHLTIDVCYTGIYPPRAVSFFNEYHSPEKILERHAEGYMIVAGRGGEPIGTGVLVGGGVAGVFVHPRHQGTGCGRLIMEVLEAEAASQGVGTIELDVSLPSRAFYERLGYTILEEAFIDVGQGESLAYWKACKSVSAA